MSQSQQMQGLLQDFNAIAQLPHDPVAKAFLRLCQSHTLKVDGKYYKYYQCGSGPTVLHVHGVNSNLGSMVPIANNLREQGYRVVLFDAPAHGEALGTTTDPIEVRNMIRGLYGRLGELEAVVAHSLGGLWALAAAMNVGVRARLFVTISAPSDMKFVVGKFAEFNSMDDATVQEFALQLEHRLGPEMWSQFSPTEVVKTIAIPGLIIHGEKDEFVPPKHADSLHANWPQSAVELVEDVEHFDIVGSPKVWKIISTRLQEVRSTDRQGTA